MSEVFIGLGSNQDSPVRQIKRALSELRAHSDIVVVKISSLYRSAPWGKEDQPDFINMVLKISTTLSPYKLWDILQSIEKTHKRTRGEKWGPRTLDLDILLFGELELNSPELTIPHLYLTERAFVIYPLAEIAPELSLPNGRTIQNILANCTYLGKIERIRE